jgi:hypothetical protein
MLIGAMTDAHARVIEKLFAEYHRITRLGYRPRDLWRVLISPRFWLP